MPQRPSVPLPGGCRASRSPTVPRVEVLVLLAIAFVLGAFPTGVPSSAVVGYFVVREELPPWQAVAAATMGITLGRILLWAAARRGARFLVRGKTAANLDYLSRYLEGRRRTRLALFLAPMIPGAPSSAVFASTGILRLPLAPVALGFVVGRLLWFGPLALGFAAADGRFDNLDALFSPLFLLPGLAILGVTFFVLLEVDWRRSLTERRPRLLRSSKRLEPAPDAQ